MDLIAHLLFYCVEIKDKPRRYHVLSGNIFFYSLLQQNSTASVEQFHISYKLCLQSQPSAHK